MPTSDEKEVLKIIEEEGGESHIVKVANRIGLRLVYTKTIIGSMGRRDFIDVSASGKVKLTDKGWRALGKSPGGAPYSEEGAPSESPEEKYKKWVKGEAQKKRAEKTAQGGRKDTAEAPFVDPLAGLPPEEKYKKWTSK